MTEHYVAGGIKLKIINTVFKLYFCMSEREFNFEQKNPFTKSNRPEERLKDYILREKRPIGYRSIISDETRVIAFGEHHIHEGAKREIIRALETLREKGVTHLALEMFGRDFQKELDRYIAGGSNKRSIYENLKNCWGYPDRITDLYMDIIDNTKNSGLQLIALDIPQKTRESFTESDQIEINVLRDQKMAESIKMVLDESPNNKIVTISGLDHVSNIYESNSMAMLLKKAGIKTTTFGLVGDIYHDERDIQVQTRQAGIENERFMLPYQIKFPEVNNNYYPEYHTPPVDWIIYLGDEKE